MLVQPDGQCGPQALTMPHIAGFDPQGQGRAMGRLLLPGQARPYRAQLLLTSGRNSAPRLLLNAEEENDGMPFMRRVFPVQLTMARTGDARCAPPVS